MIFWPPKQRTPAQWWQQGWSYWMTRSAFFWEKMAGNGESQPTVDGMVWFHQTMSCQLTLFTLQGSGNQVMSKQFRNQFWTCRCCDAVRNHEWCLVMFGGSGHTLQRQAHHNGTFISNYPGPKHAPQVSTTGYHTQVHRDRASGLCPVRSLHHLLRLPAACLTGGDGDRGRPQLVMWWNP